MFKAQEVEGCVKYGKQGVTFTTKNSNIDKKVWNELSDIAEHSMAKKTWSTYNTAERMLAKFHREKGKALELPLVESTILEFIHWLLFERCLSAASVSGYLAGVKKLHIVKGLAEPMLRTNLVKMVLEGKKNMEAADRSGQGKSRQAATPSVLRLIKARISSWQAEPADRLMVWAACTLLFHGAFRGEEILSRHSSQFDPAYTLLRRDIFWEEKSDSQKVIQVKVKAPKESKGGASVIVDIFQTDTDICPV
jgi:hypothetical protein